jgi:hypothetical protein
MDSNFQPTQRAQQCAIAGIAKNSPAASLPRWFEWPIMINEPASYKENQHGYRHERSGNYYGRQSHFC